MLGISSIAGLLLGVLKSESLELFYNTVDVGVFGHVDDSAGSAGHTRIPCRVHRKGLKRVRAGDLLRSLVWGHNLRAIHCLRGARITHGGMVLVKASLARVRSGWVWGHPAAAQLAL